MARLPVGKSSVNLDDLSRALVTLCEFVRKMKPSHLDATLAEIDLSDEGFEDEMVVIRAACGYDPSDMMNEDDEDDLGENGDGTRGPVPDYIPPHGT